MKPLQFLKNISKDQKRDALRLALQSAIAAALCYYIMKTLDTPERFLGILSAVLVIEPSIGNTFSQAKGRMLSTLVGIFIGIVFVVLLPWELGVILSLLLSMFVINGIASFKPEWRYGVVAAVALALGSESDALELSIDRLIAIAIGAAVGILVAFIVLPEAAEKRSKRYIRKALANTRDRYQTAYQNTRSKDNKKYSRVSEKFHFNLNKAKNSANTITFNDKDSFHQLINATEKLYNSILIIHRVANKSNDGVSDGESGIEKDSEKVFEASHKIIDKFSKNKAVPQEDIDQFSKLIDKTKENINRGSDKSELNVLRMTFLFGLTEIQDSISDLYQYIEKP